jgi:hypothetical protein
MYYFTFECLLVQNVAWNQYVLFYFWLFTGTECCLESVCIYILIPGKILYHQTVKSKIIHTDSRPHFVPVKSQNYNNTDGTECCLESVCIVLLLSVCWYRMLPGISMYCFSFECLLVQNVAWNQYVLFYFWLFTGTLKSKIIHTDSRQHSLPSNTQK